MSSKRGDPKKSSVKSKPWRPFSRRSSRKKKEEDQDEADIGRRLAMVSVPATTADYTPGPSVFRDDVLDRGRFRSANVLSESVTSLDVLTGVKEGENSVSTSSGNAANAEDGAKDNREAVQSSEATVSEIRAITQQIVQLQKADDDKESDDDDNESDDVSSDSDGEVKGVSQETGNESQSTEVSITTSGLTGNAC